MENGNWEYRNYPGNHECLKDRSTQLLINLRLQNISPQAICQDTRPHHNFLFAGLTPRNPMPLPHFAGNYRGANFPLLKEYEVGVRGDSRVGVKAILVSNAMTYFSNQAASAIAACERGFQLPGLELWEKITYVVRFACKLFVEFLRIHPFANGNGHMARFFIFGFLSVFGIWPKKWPLDESPPGYGALIQDYRDGNCEGLEIFVMRCLLGK